MGAPVTNGVGRSKIVAGVKVTSGNPEADAEKLLHQFISRAYRRPVDPGDEARFLGVIRSALAAGHSFTDAMLAGYTAVLSSPGFLYFQQEKPGRLDDRALPAERAFLSLHGCAVP